jgi:hypothetical protein
MRDSLRTKDDLSRRIRMQGLTRSLRVALISGAMLLALLMLSVPHVAQSLGLQPPPGPVDTAD